MLTKAIITVRSGSQRVKNKNLKPFAGSNLLEIKISQTTKSIEGFNQIVEEIKSRINPSSTFEYNDTICRQVANRIPKIIAFAAKHELILFVSGKKSSNGKVLFDECRKVNPNIVMISDLEELDYTIFGKVNSVGICGATSTPKWLMEALKRKIEQNINF